MINLKKENLSKTDTESSAEPKVRNRIANQNNVLVIMIFITLIALLFTVYFTAQLIKIDNEDTNSTSNPDNQEIFWDIEKIQANASNPQNFNLTVMSNAGQLRSYEDLVSFGLSKDGHKLAVNSTKGLEIVTLNDDSRKLITPPLEQFAGDSGNAITWNYENKYFALSIVNTKNIADTRIWIFDDEGKLQKEIQTHIPVKQTDKPIVEAIHFSGSNNAILTRTYKTVDSLEVKEDGSQYAQYELPVYLTVFDLNGQTIKDIMVRDFDVNDTQVYFGWDLKNPKLVKYGIFTKNETIDPSLEYKFTKVSI